MNQGVHVKVNVDRNETLRYLGYKGGPIPEDVERMLAACMAEIEEIAHTRYAYKVFDVDAVDLTGEDIAKHLEGCGQCILMAATLGMETDDLVRKMQVKDMARAITLDACASSAIENLCNQVEARLREEFKDKGKFITGRFSPGYGDMPVSQQRALCHLLDAQRKIGIYLTSGDAMIPVKSITAVLGISDKKTHHTDTKSNCDVCNLTENCNFRKESRNCGK